MTRMSREFSLVLLGAGILTAGYFIAPTPEEEIEKKAEEQAAKRVGHTTYRRTGVPLILFVHSPGYAGGASTRPSAMPSTNKGGFGGSGRAAGAGGS